MRSDKRQERYRPIPQVSPELEPITVTKNGYSELVVMRAEDYDTLQDELEINKEKAKLFASLLVADDEIMKGEGMDAFEFFEEMKVKYGL